MDASDGVETVGHILLGGRIAAALLGDDVDDDRLGVLARPRQSELQSRLVVPIDRPGVLDAEVLEEGRRNENVLQSPLEAVQRVEGRAPRSPLGLQDALDPGEHPLVTGVSAKGVQVVGQAADGGGVGAPVVIDDDDQMLVRGVGDVVQGLPGHASGQRPVADDGHHMAVIVPLEPVGSGDAVGP